MKYNELDTKKDRIAFLKDKLATNKNWAFRGLLRIYQCQTSDEQASGVTRKLNGVGFSGADGEILSSFATQLIDEKFAGSEKQMAILFKKMPRYARQLMNIAEADKDLSPADVDEEFVKDCQSLVADGTTWNVLA